MRLCLTLLLCVVAYGQSQLSAPLPVQDQATAATGSAVPAKALFTGGNASSNLVSLTLCDTHATLQMTTATTTQIIALTAAKKIRVCAYAIQGSTTATATTLKFVQGTGTNCATGQANITAAWSMPASSTALPSTWGSGIGELFSTTAANALCLTSSAAGTVNIDVTYTVY